jgi:prolyl-tRNA editing enzyme YbaK/EbsC (Cys-tRNA(Pro) deacylase)
MVEVSRRYDPPMWFSHLVTLPASEHLELLGAPVAAAIGLIPEALVFAIDPADAETEVLTAKLNLPMANSANAVMVTGKREGEKRNCCCMTPATRRVDVNNVVKRRLDVRKCSFAPMAEAVAESGMEYGGITPIGLPPAWPVWVDGLVADTEWVCIGSGIRASKLIVPGAALLRLPGSQRVDGLTYPAP